MMVILSLDSFLGLFIGASSAAASRKVEVQILILFLTSCVGLGRVP